MVSGPSSVAWWCNGYDVGLATHEVCTGMGTARGFPAGVGMNVAGNTAGIDLTIAGFPRGWILLRREPPH